MSGSLHTRNLALVGLALPWLACGVAPGKSGVPSPTAAQVAQIMSREAACAYAPGMMASETLPGYPTGDEIPIKHVVLLMQENRSFDHYFSELKLPGINVAPPTASNPDANGNPVQRFHFTTNYPGPGPGPGVCMDGGDHGWDGEHNNLDDGKNDNFVKTNNSPVPMGYYDETELYYYYALARTFAFSDAHFSSVLGPTWPNRMYYMAGTSWGIAIGTSQPTGTTTPDGKPYTTLFSELDAARIDWRDYSEDLPTVLIVPNTYEPAHFRVQQQFATDVANGDLAPVTMVEMSDLQGPLSADEGPPGDPELGQAFTSGVISTIMHSQFWKDTVVFLTYDENGGMYDHVVPPAACEPDDIAPVLAAGTSATKPARFNQYGFRVPFFVVSPYARRGYLSHQVGDHTAILRFLEAKFNLPAMTKRDANALPPYDMFDFNHPDFSIPELPVVSVNQAALWACENG
jgi:phospholipase C